MARGHGHVAQIVAAAIVVGAAGAAIAFYNADKRDAEDFAVLHAAVTRASFDPPVLSGRDDDWGRIAIYPVIGDGMLFPVPTGLEADVWAAFMRIVTPGFAAQNMSAMLVADNSRIDASAAVTRASVNPQHWTLTINLAADFERSEYLRTLVHEYAHLITLDASEVDPYALECKTLQLQEGCLRPGSLLHRLHERFWAGYGDLAPHPDATESSEAWLRFVRNTDQFVTVYAATNLVEDFAETFAEFVIRERPNARSGPWAEKIRFLWEQPELVAIRAHIREGFADELPRPLEPSAAHRG